MKLPGKDEVLRTDELSRIRAWRMRLESGDSSFSDWNGLDFPAKEILDLLFATGKHFGDPRLIDELVMIQCTLPFHEPDHDSPAYRMLDAWLRILLDKHSGAYDHLTYVALPIFELERADAPFDDMLRAQFEIVVALQCDLIRYELRSMLGLEHRLQAHLPGPKKLNQRVYVALRAVSSCLPYADHLRLPGDTDDLMEQWRQQSLLGSPWPIPLTERTLRFAEAMLAQTNVATERLLQFTLVPVYTSHDEYLFIRSLQAFEMIFHIMAEGLKLCAVHIAAERYGQAAERFRSLNAVLRLSPAIFRVLSTMTSFTFNTFREYMRGASAIQSTYYKQIELYAAHPDSQRFRSPSFGSVPKVMEEYHHPQFRNIQDVVNPLLANAALAEDEEIQSMVAAMRALDETFVTWKVTHYRLVKVLIGDAPGTGHTSGPPYLKQMLEYPLFPFLQERTAPAVV